LTNIRKELILAFVQKYHPATVADLKQRLNQEGVRSTDRDLVKLIRQLQSEGAINLQPTPLPRSYLSFLVDFQDSWWIYPILLSPLLEAVLVVENVQSGPGLFLRIVLGLGVLGLMPGYATVRILFPGDRLPILEQILLSIFLSVMISIGTGVALGAGYYFTGTSSILALAAYTIVSVLIAGYRRYSHLGSRDATKLATKRVGC
jgi:Protein of unknown function (DUF1616)